MRSFLLFSFSLLLGPLAAQEVEVEIPPAALQIATAVLAAPETDRDQVKVYGYDPSGELVVLREGSNNLICLADDPYREGIEVSCYSVKLDPFLARGRELRAQGKQTGEVREIRKAEAEAGSLQMPDVPSMQYILSADQDDLVKETGALRDSFMRYVIYVPWATTESTGLPDRPHLPGMPWLMDPGTHRAHIMITPAR